MFSGYSKFLVLAFLLATISQTLAQNPAAKPAPKPATKPVTKSTPKVTSPASNPTQGGNCPTNETTLCVTNLAAKVNAPNTRESFLLIGMRKCEIEENVACPDTEAKPTKNGRPSCDSGKQTSCCKTAILKQLVKKKVSTLPYSSFCRAAADPGKNPTKQGSDPSKTKPSTVKPKNKQ